MDHYFGNPNNCNPYNFVEPAASANYIATPPPPPSSEFMLSDYLLLDDVVDHPHQDQSWSQSTESSDKAASNDHAIHAVFVDENSVNNINNLKARKSGIKQNRVEVSSRIIFRTRSQIEIMDDGYKWRKYGKKKVKNSPNPRNYYKCSGEGCSVKKRVERDREDSSYVLTTYDGVHTHESPCNYYNYYTRPISSFVHSNVDQWPLQDTAN